MPRLIDADVLMPNAKYKGKYDTVNAYDIVNCPTVDAAPVRHGRWMHDKDDELITGYCSKCGWTSIIYETDVVDMPFCPNCGAKMDREREEDD